MPKPRKWQTFYFYFVLEVPCGGHIDGSRQAKISQDGPKIAESHYWTSPCNGGAHYLIPLESREDAGFNLGNRQSGNRPPLRTEGSSAWHHTRRVGHCGVACSMRGVGEEWGKVNLCVLNHPRIQAAVLFLSFCDRRRRATVYKKLTRPSRGRFRSETGHMPCLPCHPCLLCHLFQTGNGERMERGVLGKRTAEKKRSNKQACW
jgi:hypothetical protein